jgi:hypothetical protein
VLSCEVHIVSPFGKKEEVEEHSSFLLRLRAQNVDIISIAIGTYLGVVRLSLFVARTCTQRSSSPALLCFVCTERERGRRRRLHRFIFKKASSELSCKERGSGGRERDDIKLRRKVWLKL